MDCTGNPSYLRERMTYEGPRQREAPRIVYEIGTIKTEGPERMLNGLDGS